MFAGIVGREREVRLAETLEQVGEVLGAQPDVGFRIRERARREAAAQAERPADPAARRRHELHQPVGVGRRADARVEHRLLRDERGDEVRIEAVLRRVLLDEQPVVQRKHDLQHLARQRAVAGRQELRVRALDEEHGAAVVTLTVQHQRDRRVERGRAAPGLARVVQLGERRVVQLERDEQANQGRGRRGCGLSARDARHARPVLLGRAGQLRQLARGQTAVVGTSVVGHGQAEALARERPVAHARARPARPIEVAGPVVRPGKRRRGAFECARGFGEVAVPVRPPPRLPRRTLRTASRGKLRIQLAEHLGRAVVLVLDDVGGGQRVEGGFGPRARREALGECARACDEVALAPEPEERAEVVEPHLGLIRRGANQVWAQAVARGAVSPEVELARRETEVDERPLVA